MTTKKVAFERIEFYCSLPLTAFRSLDANGYHAEVLEWPGCFAKGATIQEAEANLEIKKRDYVRERLETGAYIAKPRTPFTADAERIFLSAVNSFLKVALEVAELNGVPDSDSGLGIAEVVQSIIDGARKTAKSPAKASSTAKAPSTVAAVEKAVTEVAASKAMPSVDDSDAPPPPADDEPEPPADNEPEPPSLDEPHEVETTAPPAVSSGDPAAAGDEEADLLASMPADVRDLELAKRDGKELTPDEKLKLRRWRQAESARRRRAKA